MNFEHVIIKRANIGINSSHLMILKLKISNTLGKGKSFGFHLLKHLHISCETLDLQIKKCDKSTQPQETSYFYMVIVLRSYARGDPYGHFDLEFG